MLGNARLALREDLRHLADSQLHFSQEQQDAQSCGIGQRLKDRNIYLHIWEYNESGKLVSIRRGGSRKSARENGPRNAVTRSSEGIFCAGS